MKKTIYLFLGFFIVAFLFFWGYFPTLSKYRDLKFQEEDIDRRLSELDAKIKVLEEERNLLKNDVEYLERVIRGELGLVKPGEIVYKFIEDPKIPAAVPAPAAEDEDSAESTAGVTDKKGLASAVPSVGTEAAETLKKKPSA